MVSLCWWRVTCSLFLHNSFGPHSCLSVCSLSSSAIFELVLLLSLSFFSVPSSATPLNHLCLPFFTFSFLYLPILFKFCLFHFLPAPFFLPLFTLHSFIHLVVCFTTGPKSLPKRALHIVRSRASSFKWEYPLLSLRSSNSFIRLLPCLPLTSIPPCINIPHKISC